MWKDTRITVFDAETTGLKAKEGDRIIEVGVCIIEGRKVVGSWSHLLNPEIKSLPEIITKVTGLKLEDLVDKPLFSAVAPKLNELIQKSFCLAAFNAPFDEGFFSAELNRAEQPHHDRFWLDPLVWARHYDNVNGNKLAQVCERHSITLSNAHRAAGDATATAELMVHFMDRLPDDFESMRQLQQVWRRKQEAAFKARFDKRKTH